MEQFNSTKSNSIYETIIFQYRIGPMIDGKFAWQKEEVRKEDMSIALMFQEQFFISEALQGHSGNNPIDPTLQDNVVIGTGIFPYIYHVVCTFNLHSIINHGLVPGGQNLSRRQSVLLAC